MTSPRLLAVILAGALIAAPVASFEQQGRLIRLTPEEADKCDAQGGCILASQAWVNEQLQVVRKAASSGCGLRVQL